MEKLPDYLLLRILSRLDDSADVARCRVASKAFDTVFPGLRSINILCSLNWYNSSKSRAPSYQPLKTVFLNLISKLKTVESVTIGFVNHVIDLETDDFYILDADFTKEWLPKVSGSLKSLSLSCLNYYYSKQPPSNVLWFISAYCRNLVRLELKSARLSVDNLIPMPLLTSLTVAHTTIEDEHLNRMLKCFHNLQFLQLAGVTGLEDLEIHLLNLQSCHLLTYCSTSLTLITPSLIRLTVEAPSLSRIHIGINTFGNLRSLLLDSFHLGSLLSDLPITKTVNILTLHTLYDEPRDVKLTLGKVFTVFPNLSYLCIKSGAWIELEEECLNPEDWEIRYGRMRLKRFCTYVTLDDTELSFSCVARVLDQCVGLLDVSLLIHGDVVGIISKRFMYKCMARWPSLNWRWGLWWEDMADSWITDIRLMKHQPSP